MEPRRLAARTEPTIAALHMRMPHLRLGRTGRVLEALILSGALDETNLRGSRSRLLRFEPGVYTTKPFVHEYWEEVYLISGDLIVGNDETGEGGTSYAPNTYASRPPGAYHGPFLSKNGCLLLEMHYFDPA